LATTTLNEWWKAGDKESGKAVETVIARARIATEPRRKRMKADLSMYLNRPVAELDGWAYDQARERSMDAARLNLARSVVDTVHAKLVKNLPRTSVLTDGGTWSLQRAAKALDAFIEGVKYSNNWRELFPLEVRDAMVLDTGIVKVWGERCEDDDKRMGRVRIDRVLPWELFVDPEEAVYGKPRSLFHTMTVSRHVAQARWPERAKDIEQAPRADRGQGATYSLTGDRVTLVEAWHLESPGAEDGRHVIVCEGAKGKPLVDEEWESDCFPVAWLPWSPGMLGVWGTSLVDEVAGLHSTLNEVDTTIRDRVRQSFGFVLNYLGAKAKFRIDNDVPIPIFDVEGGEPGMVEYVSPNLVNAELLGERERLLSLGYRMPGVSELSASSMKPGGLDSGVALREYQDIEAERFAQFGRAVESFDLAVSKLIIRAAKALDEADYPVIVSARTDKRRRRSLLKVDFGKIKLDESAYELQVFPSSQLPRTPSGRLAMVEQLIAAGFLQKDDAMRLLDFPDVEATMTQELAPYNIALDMIELILDEGRKVSPIPEMNLALTRRVVNLAILQATIDEAPEDRIELLRRFAAQVDALQQRAEQAMAPQGGAGFVPNPAGQLQAGLPQNAAPQGAPVIV
jgi:hypothetical protein